MEGLAAICYPARAMSLMSLIPRRIAPKLVMLPTFAAAMAFYFLIALVPFLIVVTRVVAWMFSANFTPQLTSFLRDVLPPESSLRPEALSAAVQGSGAGLGTISTLLAAYTASSGLNEMARAVHYVFSDERRPHPGGWMRRLKSLGLLGIWTAAIGATAVFLVLVPIVRESLTRLGAQNQFPALLGADVRYPAAFALMFAAFALTYQFVPEPEHRPRWRASAQGALAASAVWMGTCYVFAYFLPLVWGVSLFHGVLSSALATLVWAYCGCWGVLIGACWAAVAASRARD
jgi:YihY family inner membrane protein